MPPEDKVICRGSTALFSCGYQFSNFQILPPRWRINGTIHTFSQIVNDTDDLLSWQQDGDFNTRSTALSVGPVNDSFVGVTMFQCELLTNPVLRSNIAMLTVIGKLVCNQVYYNSVFKYKGCVIIAKPMSR